MPEFSLLTSNEEMMKEIESQLQGSLNQDPEARSPLGLFESFKKTQRAIDAFQFHGWLSTATVRLLFCDTAGK